MSKKKTPSPRSASLIDVAKLAGVSAQTVSRVSNKKGNVAQATLERVQQAMKELEYRPNSAARALKYGRFKAIGVIMFDISTYGNSRTLDAIVLAATRAGYSLTLVPISETTTDGLADAFDQLAVAKVDGIVLIADAELLDKAEIILPAEWPVVVANTVANDRYAVVDADQAGGARTATEHLLGLGHKTVHLIDGPFHSHSAQSRKAAWRATLEAAGAPVTEPFAGDWSADSGYRAGLEIAKNPSVTAVFALNDQMALGAIRAFHESGKRIPLDISIVGFDGVAEGANFWPPLTTIRQDFAAVGKFLIDILIEEIETREVLLGITTVAPDLVVRDSAGPAPR